MKRSSRLLLALALLLCMLLPLAATAQQPAKNSAAKAAAPASTNAAKAASSSKPSAASAKPVTNATPKPTPKATPKPAPKPIPKPTPTPSASPSGVPTVPTKEASVAAAVEQLGKADDKEAKKAFARAEKAPDGGVRLVKDIFTGKLKPVTKPAPSPPKPPAARPGSSAKGASESQTRAQQLRERFAGKMSAIVAAAVEGKNKGKDRAGFGRRQREDRAVGGAQSDNKKDAAPLHVHLGSVADSADIVRDDALQAAWNITEATHADLVERSMVPAERDSAEFFLWRTSGAGDRPRRVITAQKPFVIVGNSEVLSAKVRSWGHRHMTPIPLVEDASKEPAIDPKTKKPAKRSEILFNVQFQCAKEGRSLVTVVLRVFELTTGSRSSQSVQWSFWKECSPPAADAPGAMQGDNSALPGIMVGTRNNASDVIRHGASAPEWTEGAKVPLHTYDDDVEGVKFWLRYDTPIANRTLDVNKVVFDVDDPTVLLVEGAGELMERRTQLRADRSFPISLTFTCKKEGETNVTLIFNFPKLDSAKVSFSFRKLCSGLAVGDGATMNGIDIWQDENADDRLPEVVQNGVVQPEWRPLQNVAAENEVDRATADKDQKFVSFFVKLRKAYHPVEYDPPVVESYSPSGEVILRPTLTGGLMEASKLVSTQPRFLVLAFNCIRDGEAVVTVKIPFRPSGSLQFNMRKVCSVETDEEAEEAAAVQEYSSGDQLTPLPGINVGHYLNGHSVVRDGIPSPFYHLSFDATVEDLMIVGKRHQWINFFLWKNSSVPDAKDVRFGRPELISTADIARPVVSGLGAEGGLITDEEYSTISVTFHCFVEGNTTLTLIIPLTSDEWLNARNEPVKIDPPRSDPIKISFVKQCPSAQEEPVIGMGGIGISGFSMGFSRDSSELVYNGFPQPKYFGQRSKPRPDWDDIILGADVPSTTFYLHYNSRELENVQVGNEVVFQAPVIISHNPTARPVLAGAASEGGVLLRDGEALPLDLTFNCRYSGLAVVTLIIPIVPAGQISVTLPKRCTGEEAPHGVRVSGLHVGITQEGTEVVRDGQTQSSYLNYATKKYLEHKVRADEDMSVFYLRKEGDAQLAIEPLIYVHTPVVSVRIAHNMGVNATEGEWDEDSDGDQIEINEEFGMLNVTYACVQAGKTDITVSLNLIPKGQVQWTWEKHCDMEDSDWASWGDAGTRPGGLGGLGGLLGGLDGGGSQLSDGSMIEPRYVDGSLGEASAPFGAGFNWDADGGEFEQTAPMDSFARMLEEHRQAAQREQDKAERLEASISPGAASSSEATRFLWDDEYNPHSALDAASARTFQKKGTLAHLRVGTGKDGAHATDVFHRSLPQSRYQMKSKASLDASQYAVIKPDQDSVRFYLSTSEDSLTFGAPRVQLAAKYAAYLRPTLSGPAATGGTLNVADQPMPLDLNFNCDKGGVFAVPVLIPVGEEFSLFRVLKICPNYELQEEFYFWTAGRMLSLIGLVAVIGALVVGFIMFRRLQQQKKASTYIPVQQEVVEMQEH